MSKPNFEDSYAVTMFSLTNELLEAKHTPLELLEQVLASGLTRNIEIDGPQHFRNYPNPADAEIAALKTVLEKHGARLSLIGGYADRAIGTHIVPSEQIVESLKRQLQLVAELGCFGLRLQVDAITEEEAPDIAREAERLGVTVVFEAQGSMTPQDPRTTNCLAVINAADSPNVRLMFDASLFMTCFPPSLKSLLGRLGVTGEQVEQIEAQWLELPLPQFRDWLIGQLQTQALPPSLQSVLPTLLSRIGHSKPSDWAALAPLVASVHLKYWDNDDRQGALSTPTRELMALLADQGYRGYYCSEWGGHEWHTADELPGPMAVARHRELVQACFDQAH